MESPREIVKSSGVKDSKLTDRIFDFLPPVQASANPLFPEHCENRREE